MSSSSDISFRALCYRSTHRGCRETDVILGAFANSHLESFSESQLALYAKFLDEQDWDIFAWVIGEIDLPQEYESFAPLFAALDFSRYANETN
jgi:antitoxin CptB